MMRGLFFSYFQEKKVNQQAYKNIISENSSNPFASLLRFCLYPLSLVYLLIINIRNFLYSKAILKSKHPSVPVISIGNITTGGTGKTPAVIWLCNFLKDKNIPTAILTRGYKTKKGQFADEPAILTKNCPDTKILVDSKRTLTAKKAVKNHSVKALVMDDGFQHRKLARDIDILTIDSLIPFGYQKVLPAGLLREPLTSIKRAQAAILTRCDQTTQENIENIEKKIKSINPDIVIAKSIHSPTAAQAIGATRIPLDQLKTRKVYAFSGIGNPQSFINTLKSLQIHLVGTKIFNDHHNYTCEDITEIYENARKLEAEVILSTQKDWTKTALFAANIKNDITFAFLAIKLKFISNEQKITQLIENLL